MAPSAIGSALGGMLAAARRLEAAASNVANARSGGRPPDAAGRTEAYRPVLVVQTATEGGVSAETVPRTPAFELQMDPDHPAADGAGMVAMPAVDVASEMVDVLRARQDYAASAAVLKTAAEMERETIERLA